MTYRYDADHGHTAMVTRFTTGLTQTATYTAWDRAGRPLEATVSTAARASCCATPDEEAARTMTIRGPGSVQTHTSDEFGNLIHEQVVSPLGTTTHAVTIEKTDKVCR